MKKKWANRIVLVAVAGSVLLAASGGLNQPQALASTEDNTHNAITLPPNQGPIGAQAAPAASITAPSSTIGDFGASQGNVWDMNSVNDIVWTQPNASGRTIALSQPEAGIVHGVTPQGSDLAIGLYTSSSTNLPSSQYHHLLYRLRIAAGPQSSCATNGRVLYTTQWPNWLGHQEYTRAYSPEHEPMYCAYGNYCVYYMDLSRNDNDGRSPYYGTWSGTSLTDPSPWPTAGVKGFGMWPHEVWYNCSSQTGPAYFDLDYVYLTGNIMATAKAGYKYTANWTVSDSDGGRITSTVRYMQVDELRLPANSPVCNSATFGDQTAPPPSYPPRAYLPLIVVGGGTSGDGQWQDFSPVVQTTTTLPGTPNQSYELDFSDNNKFTDGKSYYLCIRVDDGTNKRYAVSSAPVIRAPLSPNFGPN
jgi:hypothetical protein